MLTTSGLAHSNPVLTPPQSFSKAEPVQTVCFFILAYHPHPRMMTLVLVSVMALAIIADETFTTIPKVT